MYSVDSSVGCSGRCTARGVVVSVRTLFGEWRAVVVTGLRVTVDASAAGMVDGIAGNVAGITAIMNVGIRVVVGG